VDIEDKIFCLRGWYGGDVYYIEFINQNFTFKIGWLYPSHGGGIITGFSEDNLSSDKFHQICKQFFNIPENSVVTEGKRIEGSKTPNQKDVPIYILTWQTDQTTYELSGDKKKCSIIELRFLPVLSDKIPIQKGDGQK
jgi:hypothetical protein